MAKRTPTTQAIIVLTTLTAIATVASIAILVLTAPVIA